MQRAKAFAKSTNIWALQCARKGSIYFPCNAELEICSKWEGALLLAFVSSFSDYILLLGAQGATVSLVLRRAKSCGVKQPTETSIVLCKTRMKSASPDLCSGGASCLSHVYETYLLMRY